VALLNNTIERLIGKLHLAHQGQLDTMLQIVNHHAEQNKQAMSAMATLVDAKNQSNFLNDIGKVYAKLTLAQKP